MCVTRFYDRANTATSQQLERSEPHHVAAGLQRQGQHPDVRVQLVAQAAEGRRHRAREARAWLVAEYHPQTLEDPAMW